LQWLVTLGSFDILISVKQDRSGTNSTILPDQRVAPTTARVVESLDTPAGSPVVVLESREPKAPKVVSKEAEKVGTQSSKT
jgi:hypothetical protein